MFLHWLNIFFIYKRNTTHLMWRLLWVIMKTLKIYCEIQKANVYIKGNVEQLSERIVYNMSWVQKGLESREHLLATLIKKGNGYKRVKEKKIYSFLIISLVFILRATSFMKKLNVTSAKCRKSRDNVLATFSAFFFSFFVFKINIFNLLAKIQSDLFLAHNKNTYHIEWEGS